ncbi:MAG TPA: LLM class F420-dependent oxidoreductase [Pseudonocardiaceae bacterium]|nr:LLM class F420-dependent oxidoreductase [Pseudonocardiaceae bacterium]
MRIGVVLPQTEIGAAASAVRTYGQRVEDLGFTHILAYDHVVGADPEVHQPWTGPYDLHTTFHEPMVVFGYLAAVTSLEMVTGIIILPQRQTVLAAKQAAELDLLTEGRFRFGVGIGWNAVEYEALGKDFHDRGRRFDEQIELLRRLWTEQSVTFAGEYERITAAGIAPPPVQRPIPVWLGAQSTRAYERVGRLADGWFPQIGPGDEFEAARATIDAAARAAGRDPASIQVEPRVSFHSGDLDQLVRDVARWRDRGATHLSVDTMRAGLGPVEGHVAALTKIAGALGLS